MKKQWQIIVAVLFIVFHAMAWAQPIIPEKKAAPEQNSVSKQESSEFDIPETVRTAIMSRVSAARPDLEISNLRKSPAKGLYKIDLNGQLAFVSEDGGFLIAGEMYQVTGDGLVNLQEQERRVQEVAQRPHRAKLLASIPKEDMVIYTPKKETKGHVYIFTDIDCGFCRRVHAQLDEFLAKGIEVRYLAFPRAGVRSRSAQKLATVWCAKDMEGKKSLMTEFKRGKNVALNDCGKTPVPDQYMLGQDLGVDGTPAIVLADGELLIGARSPDMLAMEMGI